ncbi:hypothetical protein [Neorhodopirellula pilleata]|uniref:Uncharacterized protein n=1 Tax=Neorhodopirellula pilleata TaxID=2714738 RepID=A0A5C6A570_9BACT|nr:hypothetical protein [Neorhodopirellula pilleata]TWT95074.1 hypothetical protein Pla100_36550 [Neorhodopirellula pilleata]
MFPTLSGPNKWPGAFRQGPRVDRPIVRVVFLSLIGWSWFGWSPTGWSIKTGPLQASAQRTQSAGTTSTSPLNSNVRPERRPEEGRDSEVTSGTSPRQPLPTPIIPIPSTVLELTGPAGLRTYRWDFSRVADRDFDRWPDDFERRKATGFPEYVAVDIRPRDPQFEAEILKFDTSLVLQWPAIRDLFKSVAVVPDLPSLPPSLADYMIDRCLEVRLDGGQAAVITPPLPTSSTYQYRFSVDIKTERLVHDRVFAEVHFTDAYGRSLRSARTPMITQTRGWQTVSIEKLLPPVGAVSMKVQLNVFGSEDGLEDIRGTIAFDNILFEQFPQMKVATDRPFGLYRKGDTVSTITYLLGLPEETADVRLRLLDHDGKEIRTTRKQLVPMSPPESSVSFDWELNGLPPGFYRLTAAMENEDGVSLANETSFAIIDRLTNDPREWSPKSQPEETLVGGLPLNSSNSIAELPNEMLPFGWSLPASLIRKHEDGEVSEKTIAGWLRDIGIGYAKMPVWYAPEATDSADKVASLALRLQDSGIEPIGVLDEPPAENIEHYRLRERGETGAAAYLHDPTIWKSQLETIMNRMTFRIKKWQLGGDDDYSFQGRADLATKISEIGGELQGFGQPLEMAIAWPWMDFPPEVSGDAWKSVHREISEPLTADELDAMLDQEAQRQPRRSGERWMSLNPLPKDRYERDDRIIDLILRMATIRGHDVDAAFATKPLDTKYSLVSADGHPEELLLPWRTASLLLGRTRNIGSLQLRRESMNIVFRGPHFSMLLIWANTPRTERLFLGDDAYQIDVWGRRTDIPTEQIDNRLVHRIEVEPVPKFIVGIDPALAEFRMSVTVDQQRIDALLGREQPVTVRYANPIGQILNGTINLETPPQWRVAPASQTWDLNANQASASNFTVTLSNDATIGHFELPIDFTFATNPPTTIRVYRKIDVGPEGFELNVTTRLINDRLLVKIQMINKTNRPANFDCLLFAGASRQYERRIMVLPPGGTIDRNIEWNNGSELIGKQMLLRAIEQDGDRVINHTFEVTP